MSSPDELQICFMRTFALELQAYIAITMPTQPNSPVKHSKIQEKYLKSTI
jgi:hypothetical protein